MATIKKSSNSNVFTVLTQHTIGRDPNNVSVINGNDVSRKHAIIHWENDCWQITDFSSNGTIINSKIIHHTTYKLKINDTIRFSNSQSEIWKIINLDTPKSFLQNIDNNLEDIILDKGVIFEKKNSKICIFQHNINKWVMDNEEEEIELIHGKTSIIHDKKYKFIKNECLATTVLNSDITQNACFKLQVSLDEESIFSKIEINDLELDLGNRTFNHLLFYLIKEKQKDITCGLNSDSCGWVNMEDVYRDLSKELLKEIDAYYINTLIYRLRKNLINLQPYGFLFANIIERKKGKLRFGFPKFKITKEPLLA